MAATAASLDAGKLHAHTQRSADHDHLPNPQTNHLAVAHYEISNNYSEDDQVQHTEQKGNQGNQQRDAIPTVVGREHLKPDHSMQNIAYKLVPDLQEREQELIRTFERSQELRGHKRTSAVSVRSSNAQPAKKHSKLAEGCLSTATHPATAASPNSSPAMGPETLVAFALELDTEWFNLRKYENVSRGQARLADPCLKTKARATIGQVGKHLRKRLAMKPAKVEILHNGSKLHPEWTLGNVAASDPIQPLIFRYRPWYNIDT
ncbi:hypothetical protein SpCBS45565_g06582 [Spizellomyces sp. 'palustris']|nr:hypothetical protein SpCBS45565_g06582 [Spizellomyces sp. 'palustris']